MRAKEFLKLFEVRMNPKSLRKEVKKINALAGLEFEMIVPDVGSFEPPEPDYQRDEDADTRPDSFDEIESFFLGGDGVNTRRTVREAISILQEEYRDWKMERIADSWDSEGLDYLRDYIENNDEFDRDEALAAARDEIIDANPDLPPESEEFQKLLSYRIDELQEEFVLESWEDGIKGNSGIYDTAFEEFADEKSDDFSESDFFQDHYPYMSDIESQFDLSWPYYYDANEGSGSDREIDIKSIASDFEDAIGRPVYWSERYHGAKRTPDSYAVEPDSSLDADEPSDTGLEFISPPLPIDEMLKDIEKVKKWAAKNGCYTNESTGLHINISVPDFSVAKMDYVKLAILLGDEYILDQFGRLGNTYTKSALKIIRDRAKNKPDEVNALLVSMKNHMGALATKSIHSGSADKYTSIHPQGGYIEFHSPGGDWLNKNFDKIESTLMRFTVALNAAMDPALYRKEYQKKLYKLLTSSRERSAEPKLHKLLSLYFSEGDTESNREIARRLAKELITKKRSEREFLAKGGKFWWNVQWDANRRMEVVAGSKEVALQVAAKEWDVPESQLAGAEVTLLRPYQEPSVQNTGSTTSGNWGVWVPSLDRYATIGNAGPRRFENRAEAEAWIQDYNQRHASSNLELQAREIEPRQGSGTYTYRVFTTDNNQTVGTFQSGGIHGSTDARIAFRQYLQSIGRNDTTGFDYQEIGRERQQPEFVDTTTQSSRGDLTPRGPGPWEIYRISDNSAVRPLSNTSRPEAEQEARSALGLRGEAPELYGVRTRQQAAPTSNTGSLGSFTGQWKIVDSQGREIHRFSGIGNVQADANRVAIQWLQRNPRHMQAGVEVLPVMD